MKGLKVRDGAEGVNTLPTGDIFFMFLWQIPDDFSVGGKKKYNVQKQ